MHNLQLLEEALTKLKGGFTSFPDTLNNTNSQEIGDILQKTAQRLHDNFPYPQTEYAGQMIKPPHAVARLAYMMALYINPNNHALDGGRASSAMEKETVAELAKMVGWKEHLGHLTSGGTFANLEALWVSGKLRPDKKVVASELAHYTHERISAVLGLPFGKVAADKQGRLDIPSLEAELKMGTVGTVVVTLGTTGAGAVDPLADILALREQYDFRIHVDGAYGGYFTLSDALSDDIKRHYRALSEADSLVVDPHKHGLQPYGCGSILFRDPSVGRFYKHDSPYTYFSSAELHLGEISLECSRAGAAAVALWATQQLFPMEYNGRFAQEILDKCLAAAEKLYEALDASEQFTPLFRPELDIVVWIPKGVSFSEISAHSRRLFEQMAQRGIHLALFNYPKHLLPDHLSTLKADADHLTCLRSCLMKPEHLEFVERMMEELEDVVQN
ncbi:MAG: aminotransferase class V-fold PLP-dependent enzyme [Bacteroidota bacterium]